ncbi:MAG: pyridoxamine 5'-phosphate oxidase family protein [Clostridiales bacterium]|nr:pyridoxamine 5'-phosphate oxidase family protein [Clostridiales bacterium]
MNRVYEFLKEAQTYYLATDDHGQPRVRPFGTIHVFEGKLYLQTGKGKQVERQMLENPKVEICAMKGGEWLRLAGSVELDQRTEAQESMLDAYPSLREMYTTGPEGNTSVFYFKDATATISAFTHEPEVITF